MKAFLHRVTSSHGRRYITIGVSVYFIEVLVIQVSQKLGASAVLAVGLSFWIGLVVSFGLQKLVTFRDHRMHHKIIVPQLIRFAFLVLFNFSFTLLVTRILSHLLPVWVTRTLALAVTTLWNFYLYKSRIFKIDSENVVY